MTIASQLDHEHVAASMQKRLPLFVLQYIGSRGLTGCRLPEVRSACVYWLPSGLSAWVASFVPRVLEWFEARGDLTRGKGGIYRCIPPYCIGSDIKEPSTIQLYGDPTPELSLRAVLDRVGGYLQYQPARESGRAGNPEDAEWVGCIRTITAPNGAETLRVINLLRESGYNVYDPTELGFRVRGIEHLLVPNEARFTSTGPSGGFWSDYNPMAGSDHYSRWRSSANVHQIQSRLVRWHETAEGSDYQYRRYFLHVGRQRLLEIDWDLCCWWRFKLDHEDGNPVTAYWPVGREWLVTASPFPISVNRWLTFLAQGPVERLRGVTQYMLSPDIRQSVTARLKDLLGIRVSDRSAGGAPA